MSLSVCQFGHLISSLLQMSSFSSSSWWTMEQMIGGSLWPFNGFSLLCWNSLSVPSILFLVGMCSPGVLASPSATQHQWRMQMLTSSSLCRCSCASIWLAESCSSTASYSQTLHPAALGHSTRSALTLVLSWRLWWPSAPGQCCWFSACHVGSSQHGLCVCVRGISF